MVSTTPNPANGPRGPSPLVVETIEFPTRRARAVIASPTITGAAAIAALGLSPARGVIALNGGTRDLRPELLEPLRAMLVEGLARIAREERLTVVTGATDAGIFALCGEALGERAEAAVIGVAPAGRVTWPQREERAGAFGDERPVPLEPHHSHFLLVEGDQWGDETEAMLALLAELEARRGSVAVLAGGGDGAKMEALGHARQGRAVITLAGSGRFADELASAVAGDATVDAATAEIAASGVVSVVYLTEPATALAERIRERLRHRTLRERVGIGGRIRKVAMLRDVPWLRWQPGATYPLVRPELRQRAAGLRSEFEALDRELVPTFNELDRTALRSQNYFRLGQLLLIVGGLLATALGALQTALGAGVLWIAIVGAVVSGGLSGIVFYMRGRNLQREYYSARLKAELLRGEYFVFLGHVGDYTAKGPDERIRTLRRRVAEIESAEMTA